MAFIGNGANLPPYCRGYNKVTTCDVIPNAIVGAIHPVSRQKTGKTFPVGQKKSLLVGSPSSFLIPRTAGEMASRRRANPWRAVFHVLSCRC